MLSSLRKRQKGILLFVFTVIVISFLFFGTYSSFITKPQVAKNEIVTTSQKGRILYSNDVKALGYFLSRQVSHRPGIMQGLLKDEVIERVLFDTKLLERVVANEAASRPELSRAEWKKRRQFVPYEHPSRILSAKVVWKSFLPKMVEHFEELALDPEDAEFATRSARILCDLFRDQMEFSPEMLRQILLYQQNQYSRFIQADSSLTHEDLHLFYARDFDAFFGEEVKNRVAHELFRLYNEAEDAKIKVSSRAAHRHLREVCAKHRQKEVEQLVQAELQNEGISLKDLEKAVQMFLVADAYLESKASVTVDPVLFKKEHLNTLEETEVTLISFDDALLTDTPEKLLKLDLYLKGVLACKDDFDFTALPIPEEKVAADFKLGVYRLEYAMIDRERIEKELLLKDVYAWEISGNGWKKLHDAFAQHIPADIADLEKRRLHLDTMAGGLRQEIDDKARACMVSENPFRIKECLAKEKAKSEDVTIPLAKGVFVLGHLEQKEKLIALFEKALSAEPEAGALEMLSCYSEDGRYFYRIRTLAKVEPVHVGSYGKLYEHGVLEALLAKRLEGEDKKKMAKELCSRFGENAIELEEGYYIPALGDVLVEWKRSLEAKGIEEVSKMQLLNEWKLGLAKETLTRAENPLKLSDEVFDAAVGSFSGVEALPSGKVVFYRIERRSVNSEKCTKMIEEETAYRKRELKREWMQAWPM